MSHLNRIGWVNAITYTGYMEYLNIVLGGEVASVEGSEGRSSEVRNQSS